MSTYNYKAISLEKDGGITVITLESMSLGRALTYELAYALKKLELDPDVKAVILTGRKNMFLSGIDFEEVSDLTDFAMAKELLEIPEIFYKVLFNFEKILIAAINGYCLGAGLELTLACDFRIAINDVKNLEGESVPFIGCPHVRYGMVPHLGGTQLLPKIVGISTAKELIFSAEPITAQRAYEIGLIDKISTANRLLDDCKEFAQKIMKNSQVAVRHVKKLINQSYYTSSFDEALALEREAFARCCESDEKKERIAEFLEKRKPHTLKTNIENSSPHSTIKR